MSATSTTRMMPLRRSRARACGAPVASLLALALLLAACGGDGVARMGVDEAREAQLAGTALIVDVRPASSFLLEHIESALSVPEYEIAALAAEIPRNKLLITYCS